MEGDAGSWYGGSGYQAAEWSPDRGLDCAWNKSTGKGSPVVAAFNGGSFNWNRPPESGKSYTESLSSGVSHSAAGWTPPKRT